MDKVARVYQYLFYHILFWATRRDPFPQITGFWTMAMVTTLNIGTLLFVIRPIIPQLTLSTFMVVCGISLIPQYFCVLHRRRYQQVVQRYECESPRPPNHPDFVLPPEEIVFTGFCRSLS